MPEPIEVEIAKVLAEIDDEIARLPVELRAAAEARKQVIISSVPAVTENGDR